MKTLLLVRLIVAATTVPMFAQITISGTGQGVFITTAGVGNTIAYALQGSTLDNGNPNFTLIVA